MTFNKYSDIDIAVTSDMSYEDQLKLYAETNNPIEHKVGVKGYCRNYPFQKKYKVRVSLFMREKVAILKNENIPQFISSTCSAGL